MPNGSPNTEPATHAPRHSPWLPTIPAVLDDDPEWGSYLRVLSRRIDEIAATVTSQARGWTPTSAPRWALPLLDRDSDLVSDLAVWRASHDVPGSERRPTGPPIPDAAAAAVQSQLTARVAAVLGDPRAATARWKPLADSIDTRIAADPYWPVLADRLVTADRVGLDIATLTRVVGLADPLPDEQPAAALWWRLARHLSPAAMTATDQIASASLRPDWTPELTDLLGHTAADRVLADPSWPALVAAVTHAHRAGWEPADLLSTARDLLTSGQPDDAPIRPDELTTALIWRIGVLTDPTAPSRAPATHRSADPAALSVLPDAAADLDDDWLASLVESDPAERELQLMPLLTTAATEATSPPEPGPTQPAGDPAICTPSTSPPTNAAPLAERRRIAELNALAAEYFTTNYPASWAPRYLRDRLGPAAVDDPRISAGYAPDRWTGLTDHLRSHGATDAEIVAAGLGRIASTGRVIDRFRDRLVFPITAPTDDGTIAIRGWIGRRNPTRDDDTASPKYTNTPATSLFSKGHELFGLAESRDAIAAGATIVLVEGPLDAYAITLSGDGNYVGVAPLGTALTDTQARTLIKAIPTGGPAPIVATDSDLAGQKAAYRDYWQLTAYGADPGHLILTECKDPADLLHTDGPDRLRHELARSRPLADTIIDNWFREHDGRLQFAEGRVAVQHAAAEVIAALPHNSWLDHIELLAHHLDPHDPDHRCITKSLISSDVLDARERRDANPSADTHRHLNQRPPGLDQNTTPIRPRTSTSAPATATWPTPTWVDVCNAVDPQITADSTWPTLALSLDRAADNGHDVPALVRALTHNDPLPDDHPARHLDFRIANAFHRSDPRTQPADADIGTEPLTTSDRAHSTPPPPSTRPRTGHRPTPPRGQ